MPNKIVNYNISRDHTSLCHSTVTWVMCFYGSTCLKGLKQKFMMMEQVKITIQVECWKEAHMKYHTCQELQAPSINHLHLSKISTFVVFKKCVSCPRFFSQPMSEKLGTPTLTGSKTAPFQALHSEQRDGYKKIPFSFNLQTMFYKDSECNVTFTIKLG